MREINSIVDDIHKRIDRIEGKYRHPKIKNSNENLLMEISKLKQQVQDYEKERQTFIVIFVFKVESSCLLRVITAEKTRGADQVSVLFERLQNWARIAASRRKTSSGEKAHEEGLPLRGSFPSLQVP